ncbi:serine hydrolase [Puteibacter caeruleilacunae]|nr:serine hydrolase [Puteibacter caeruleilacunae]
MKTITHTLFTGLVLITSTLSAQQVSVSDVGDNLDKQIEKILGETGVPSISYTIFDSDSLLLSNAIGYSNVSLKVPVSKNTIYNTGSTFKFVTAMSIMQLHAANKLNIDLPIANYLKGTSYTDLDKDNPVTLRHLLSHRSGLAGETIRIPIWERDLPAPLDSLIKGIKPFQKPGIEFKYCNYCYGIAGLIIQNITNQTFDEYVKENLLKPLSIKDTAPFNPTPEMTEKMALPYNKENNTAVAESYYRYNVYPAGDAYFTPAEMATLLIPQLNNGSYNGVSILDSVWVAEMQTNQFTPNKYGLGIGLTPNKDGKLLLHGGSVPGFSSYFILDTKTKKGIYTMANCSDSGDILLALSEYAIKQLRGGGHIADLPSFAKKEYREKSLNNDLISKYTGKYELAPEVFMNVFVEDAKLFIQVTRQPKVQIYPYEANKFFLKVTDAQVVFNLIDNGQVKSLTLHQKGKSINAIRL